MSKRTENNFVERECFLRKWGYNVFEGRLTKHCPLNDLFGFNTSFEVIPEDGTIVGHVRANNEDGMLLLSHTFDVDGDFCPGGDVPMVLAIGTVNKVVTLTMYDFEDIVRKQGKEMVPAFTVGDFEKVRGYLQEYLTKVMVSELELALIVRNEMIKSGLFV